ncbi:MAG: type II 3-dehydroquinate dehydratase [Pseudomonadota bacterium]
MAHILILNGPNLNLLGKREPEKYGHTTLAQIEQRLHEQAGQQHQCHFLQTNSEAVLLERIHQTINEPTDFILINPAAFTHTSIALRDALLGVRIPFIEVHLSNIYARETFRQHSYLSDIATGVISGLGAYGYELAFSAALQFIHNRT